MKIILILVLVILVVGTQCKATYSKRISDFKIQNRLKHFESDGIDEQILLEEIVQKVRVIVKIM